MGCLGFVAFFFVSFFVLTWPMWLAAYGFGIGWAFFGLLWMLGCFMLGMVMD